jgi:dTDP-4-dehydrorhamnose reductase
MRILLLGKNGQVGWELRRVLAPLGEVLALGRQDVDLQDLAALRDMVLVARPEVIVNAAAYTDVDRAESEPESAFAINGEAPGVLAEAARALHAVLVHYSTDYVFDGDKAAPYEENDAPNPINAYGKSKLLGESRIQQAGGSAIILRTSWVYGLRRENFVTKVLRWAEQGQVLRVATDQVGSPTWCRLLAECTALLLARLEPDPYAGLLPHAGVYHLAGSGQATRYEWAQAVLQYATAQARIGPVELLPATAADFPSPARRPAYSALNCRKFESTFGLHLPDWRVSLEMAMDQGKG